MKASIVIIGDEILLGQVTDTNSGSIARLLGPEGWELMSTRVVGDDAHAISQAIKLAMNESDLVITTGGLGPTKDDITKRVLTQFFGGELRLDPEVTANIEEVFAKRNLQLNELTRLQALVPTSCRVIQNIYGTAPIMWFERDCSSGSHKVLIAMPGVPFETIGMMHHAVLDEIRGHFNPHDVLLHHTLIVSGISESALAQRLATWEEALPQAIHLAYLPNPGYIRLRLDAKNVAQEVFDSAVSSLKALVADLLLYDRDATPAEILLDKLRQRGLTVASAESCTGGNIAHRITSIPGSSDCFLGSVVSYSNSVKSNVLGVSTDDLATYGAVSEPVVRQMVTGAARVLGTDCAVATSGIAGPGGGTPDKPVGTVWMAVLVGDTLTTHCYHFPGNRDRVIDRATTEAILMLIRALNDN